MIILHVAFRFCSALEENTGLSSTGFAIQIASGSFVMATGRFMLCFGFVFTETYLYQAYKIFSISVFKLKIHGGIFLVWFDIQVPKNFKSKSDH